jgi:predicted transposase YdaD
VIGDIIPIQIIDSRKLSEAENIWLKDLDNTLNVARINRLTLEIERLGKATQVGAYVDAIARANAEMLKEAIKMSKNTVTLEQVLVETGLAAKWEAKAKAEGKAEGKVELARNLVKMGVSLKKVAQAAEMDIKTVKSLVQP